MADGKQSDLTRPKAFRIIAPLPPFPLGLSVDVGLVTAAMWAGVRWLPLIQHRIADGLFSQEASSLCSTLPLAASNRLREQLLPPKCRTSAQT